MTLDTVTEALPPLGAAHHRIWARAQIGSDDTLPPMTLGLIVPTDARRVLDALAQLEARHPALRSRFERDAGGAPVRSVAPAGSLAVDHETAGGDLADALRARLAAPRLSLLKDCPARVFVLDAPDETGIGLALHPILADAEAMAALAEDLLACLGGTPPAAPAQASGTPDIADPQSEAARRAFWRARFAVRPDAPGLPRRHGAEDENDDARTGIDGTLLPPATMAALDAFGARLSVDRTGVIAAAATVALARYAGTWQPQALLTRRPDHPTGLARREDVLPLLLDYDPRDGFATAARHLDAIRREAEAQAVPSDLLRQDRLAARGGGRYPLGRLVIATARAPSLPDGARLVQRPAPMPEGELVLLAEDGPDGMHLSAHCAPSVFDPALVARFCGHVARILDLALADPERPLRDLPLVEAAELDALSAPYPDDAPLDPRPVHELIARHATMRPDAPAILCAGVAWTHAEVDSHANRLAQRLRAAGVAAETPVAILVERGAEAVIAILATLKAGGAYIPVEPTHPESRNHHILRDAGVRVVLTHDRWRDRLPPGTEAEIVTLDGAFAPGGPLDAYPLTAPDVPVADAQAAYIMYTSGSTGAPKGVVVEHGPLTRHNQATARLYEMSETSRELPFLPFSSDGGHERWMVPLMEGGSVVIPDGPVWTPEQTLTALSEHRCTHASIPTTYLRQLAEWADHSRMRPPMHLYSFGGEGLPRETFDLLSRNLNAEKLINGYGPTETIMTPMVWKIAAGTGFEGAYAPLGRAVGLRRAYVLDADMMPCPIGVTGEIHLGGDGVARGYAGRPGLTAERFVPDPFGEPGGRLYRSGDLGRWREDGTIEFLGRVDHQVKLNGHRIEPGEIEAALRAEPDVGEAVVLLRELGGEPALVAYAAPRRGRTLDEAALSHALAQRLPRHMLPRAVVVLDRMPTSPNAKLDRAALPLPSPAGRAGDVVPPEGALEALILDIWRQVLGTAALGVTDTFFEVGGNSLGALKILHRLRVARPDLPATVADMFNFPTVRGLAAHLGAPADAAAPSQAVYLRREGTRPRLYCFPGLLVSTREYLRLTEYLGPDQPVTGFLCQSLNARKTMNVSVPDVVADYVAHIRAEAARRPCAFLGWSWGGLLAWEAARQLRDEVDLRLIGMVDVCELGADFAPGAPPDLAPGNRAALEARVEAWLSKSRMRGEWETLLGSMDAETYAQFLAFVAKEERREPLPTDGPEVASREHTFWVLIDNAIVFRRHAPAPLDVPVASFAAEDSLSRGLSLIDWRRLSPRAAAPETVPGTDHLHIIGDRLFHARFAARLTDAFAPLA